MNQSIRNDVITEFTAVRSGNTIIGHFSIDRPGLSLIHSNERFPNGRDHFFMAASQPSMGFLLHVYEQRTAWSESVQRGLERSGLRVETCSNVYTAMARLLKNAPDHCVGLFLCVDWFSDAEADFLAALHRLPRPVTVWGYANRAVTLPGSACNGVRMIDDAGQVDFILAKLLQSGVATADRPAAAERKPASDNTVTPPPPPTPQGLPVPWADRGDRPARTPPIQAARDAALLSNEEIDALTAAPPLNPRHPESNPHD